VDGDGADELVICSGTKSQSLIIYKIQAIEPYLRSMASEEVEHLNITGKIKQIEPYYVANKIGKNIALLDEIGNLHLLRYGKNGLKSEFSIIIPESNLKNYKCKIICGQFINSGPNDNLIIFYTEKKSGRCYYKIYGFDNKVQHIETLVQGVFDNKCDTLYPDNSFFSCDINNDKIDELISCSNGWRYDTKLVTFTKDGYDIKADIDFTGYLKDYNPKYFENLTMVAGNFIENNSPTIFTFCGSAKKENVSFDGMKPYIGIFSYKNKN
jgi:hypothetical protein